MATDSQNALVPGLGLPPDVVEDILAAPERRAMVRCLSAAENGLVMDDLVSCVIEADATTSDASTRSSVRERLYDEHLPKLMATGVVTYDSMCESVELATAEITTYLD